MKATGMKIISTTMAPVLVCLGLMLSTAGAATHPPQKEVSLLIERKALRDALNDWAQQTGFQLVSEIDGDFIAPRVAGTLTPQAALEQLLSGTSLTYEWLNERVVAIRNRSKAGLPAAEQRHDSGIRMAQVPVDGAAASREDDEIAIEQSEPKGQEIVVTGSRLKHSSVDGPSPVTIFDRAKIDELGVTNVADVLNYLPQQSFSINEQNNFAGSRIVRLRGLGVGTSLVLVNGRRTVTSALLGATSAFDLNTIPMPAVDRIEILSDSASAVYGADAVGGVVNVVLKKEIGHPEVGVYYGMADGGANERRATVSLGHNADRFQATLILDVFDRDFLLGADRDLYADRDFRRFGSSDRRVATANPGNITSRTTANLPGLSSRFAAVPVGSTGVGLTPASFTATAGQRNLESISRFASVIPESRRAGGTATLDWTLTDDFHIFGEALYSDREDSSLSAPATLSNANVPATNAFNPFGVAVSANYLLSGIGPQHQFSDADSLRLVTGLRGALRTWDWEVSVLHTDEDGTNWTENRTDSARVTAALASNDPAQALNVFQDGAGGSAALLQSLVAAPVYNRYSSEALQESAFVRGEMGTLPAGQVQIVLGAEFRKEEILFDRKSSNTFLTVDRDSASVYSELQVPIAAAGMHFPLLHRLAATVAGRYDDYDDFGSTFNPQFGLEWYPVPHVLLRASTGTSFRPPSLFELNEPPRSLNTVVFDPRRNNESASYTLSLGGNPNLQPEESDSTTFGFVLTPQVLGRPRVAVSYWSIDQDLRVQAISPELMLANEAFFPTRIVRALPSASDAAQGLPGALISIDSPNLNFGQLKTSGVDAEVSASFETGRGRFLPAVSVTWVDRYDAATFPNTPPVDRVDVADAQGTIPKWRGTASLAWQLQGFGISANARYVPSYDDVDIAGVRNSRKVEAKTLIDIQTAIRLDEVLFAESVWARELTIRAGATNVFNEAPSFSEVVGLGFDYSQADTRQRFVYASISKAF